LQVTGKIRLTAPDSKVEASIPFIIKNGKLAGFDALIVKTKDGEKTFAYNSKNMKTVAEFIKSSNTDSPYEKIDDFVNPSTDVGFLQDLIAIRDRGATSTGRNGNHWVKSADEMLESVDKIRKFSSEDLAAVSSMVMSKVAEEAEAEFEKCAEYDITSELEFAKKMSEGLKKLPLKPIHSMKNGQRIAFPQFKDSQISTRKGLVFTTPDEKFIKDIFKGDKAMAYGDNEFKAGKVTVVLADDGDYQLVPKSEPFYALEDDSAFKMKTKRVDKLNKGEMFMVVAGDVAYYPMKVRRNNMTELSVAIPLNRIEQQELNAKKSLDVVSLDVSPMLYDNKYMSMFTYFKGNNEDNTKLTVIEDRQQQIKLLTQDALSKEAAQTAIEMMPFGRYIAVDNDLLCIELKEPITGYLTNVQDIEFGATENILKTAGEYIDKVASSNNVELELMNSQKGLYDLTINYTNKGKGIFTDAKKEFSLLTDREIKSILMNIGYNGSEVAELFANAEKSRTASKPLPTNANIGKVTGGDVKSKSDMMVDKVKRSLFSQAIADGIFTNVLGSQLGQAMGESEALRNVGELVSKWANESKECSIYFEKKASEMNDTTILDVAKVMTTSYYLAEKLAKAEDGLMFVKEACANIVAEKDGLAKMAMGLMSSRHTGFVNDTEVFDSEILKSAINNIDMMFNVASVVNK
jgi:hypothetical protein